MIDLKDLGAAAFLVEQEPDGHFLFVEFNRAAQKLTKLSPERVVGKHVDEVFTVEKAHEFENSYRTCLTTGTTIEIERVLRMPSGVLVTRTTLTPLFERNGRAARRVLGVSVDITEQARLRDELKRSNTRLAIAIEALDGAHWYYDVAQHTFELSPGFKRILGEGAPLHMEFDEWLKGVHPDDRQDTCFANLLAGRIDKGEAEFRVIANDGETRWLRCRRQSVRKGDEVSGIAGVVIDVTEEKHREQVLQAQAASDPLTGLANRRRFDSVLEEARDRSNRGEALSLLLIDVDFFKRYNDSYGHPAGDVILQRVAAGILQAVEPYSGLVARYGGEEFAVVLRDCNLARAAEAAHVILRTINDLAEPHREAPLGTLSVSIGVAGGLQGAGRLDLVALADAALYQAKSDGRNCSRVMLSSHLRAAIENGPTATAA